MRRILFSIVLFSALLGGCRREHIPSSSTEITIDELRSHVRYLASDELEGRLAGSRGNEAAARYIAQHFTSYGLRPLGDNGTYLQTFEFVSGVKLGRQNALRLQVGSEKWTLEVDKDFRPLAFTSDTTVQAQLAFVGYGISSDSVHYDDYATVDVAGKIVMVLRYTPEGDNPHSSFSPYSPFQRKAMVARDKGAVGMIVVTGPLDDPEGQLMPLRYDRGFGTAGMLVVHVRSLWADSLLSVGGKSLKTIQSEINAAKIPQSFVLDNVTVSLKTEVLKTQAKTANVLGLIEGTDPTLRDEFIVLGAHFDHLGLGGEGSGSLKPDTVAVHNGADDNASGSAALLELAQALAAPPYRTKRSLILAAFSGEELGLLGSAYYVKNPPVPLEKTVAMINMDMVGRLRDSTLTIEGVGTAPMWKSLVERTNAEFGFKLRTTEGGFGPSDHSSFYGKDIADLFVFTGVHEDYHKPSDDWEKINYQGEQRIAQFVLNLVRGLDEGERPQFARVQTSPGSAEGRRGFRVSFGIVPDFGEDANGLKISGTRDGSPAAKAGLKEGDIITKFGGKDVKGIYDLTYLLEEHKPGDEVEVVFRRGDETITVEVTLEARR
jgi:hypothetical protein